MSSVRKLILVPAEVWEEVKNGTPSKIGNKKMPSVNIPLRKISEPPNPTPTLPPSAPPWSVHASAPGGSAHAQGEKRGEKGEGGGEEGGENKYVKREDSGMQISSEDIKKDVGIWRPPGWPDNTPVNETKGGEEKEKKKMKGNNKGMMGKGEEEENKKKRKTTKKKKNKKKKNWIWL